MLKCFNIYIDIGALIDMCICMSDFRIDIFTLIYRCIAVGTDI